MVELQRSGLYAWLKHPKSQRKREDARLLNQIKQFWIARGFAYGYRNIAMDLRDIGESCGHNPVQRITRAAGLRPRRGYQRHPGFKGGRASHVAPNNLARQFHSDRPNKVWVTDYTYGRTEAGWLYVTVVLDFFSRQEVGCSMKNNPRADLVIDALLMSIWRRQPQQRVLIHPDQGVQYTCSDWRKFLNEHNLEASISRPRNCHDNAMAESFLSLLKTERIKRKIYKTRNQARAQVFNTIELFYNRQRRHGNNDAISPIAYEQQYFEKLSAV